MTKIKFALLRKSGYISPYSLAMVYPSYRRSRHYALAGLNTSGHVAPIMVQLPIGGRRWIQVWPPLVRFPSWVARKAQNRDAEGFFRR